MKPNAQQLMLAFADRSMSRPVKAKLRAVEKRQMHRAQKKAMIKALNERDMLMRLWKKWRQELLTEALQSDYQAPLQKLVDYLNKLTLQDQTRLIKIVRHGHWQKTPSDIRFLVLRLIDAKLIALREKQELPPFDDALPGEPLTAFQKIRGIIYPELQRQ